ncbi:hypothetical protein DL98DRAFT_541239 [Cadophora sp. DSE1049]|nr:hypothetical protein DL98DRAFT_541239 [Cadophora sp. DSE1049]
MQPAESWNQLHWPQGVTGQERCISLDVRVKRQFGNSAEITIPYEKLAQFLNTAEEMQESREPAQGSRGHSAKSKRKTRKRKRTSSPLDQLGSADEAERQNQEAKAEERTDAVDEDFGVGILVGVHDQAPRRSTRQKLGGV